MLYDVHVRLHVFKGDMTDDAIGGDMMELDMSHQLFNIDKTDGFVFETMPMARCTVDKSFVLTLLVDLLKIDDGWLGVLPPDRDKCVFSYDLGADGSL
jgi:hypothetical protein